MPILVIPNRVTESSARVWVGAFRKEAPPDNLHLHFQVPGEPSHSRRLKGPWRVVGGGSTGKAFFQWLTIPLAPNKCVELSVRAAERGRVLGTGELESLPEFVPVAYSGKDPRKRPFTVLVGSCFHKTQDKGRVEEAYWKIVESGIYRPHIKIFLGDQVYVDQKKVYIGLQRPVSKLRSDFTSEYRVTWQTKLPDMLQHGANFFTSDDHEFWNNFPTPPTAVPPLAVSASYRKRWTRVARELYDGIQGGRHTSVFSLANELSFFVADTRLHRTSRPVRFLRDSDMKKLASWVKTLRSPGVLCIGQPIFATRDSPLKGRLVDYSLPNFAQYEDLVRALARAKHDIVLVAGDVHFGRIATAALGRGRNAPKLVEVISSPLSLVSSFGHLARGLWRLGKDVEPRLYPDIPVKGIAQSHIHYVKAVRASSEARDRAAENFMTLAFARGRSSKDITMTVRAWLVREVSRNRDLPVRDWTWKTQLR